MKQNRRVAIALTLATFAAAPALAIQPDGGEPRGSHEECAPERAIGVLRDTVEWWAADGSPVALAAQLTSDADEAAGKAVPWRLLITTLDRKTVDVRTGLARFGQETAAAPALAPTLALVNFDGKDALGHPLPAGSYVYRFEAPGYEGSGGFLFVHGTDEAPVPPVADTKQPLASSLNPNVPYSFYFGSQHAHTNYSDGGTAVATCTGSISSPHAGASPTDAFAYAKANGSVDWICVIEHNHLIDDACGGCTTATIQQRYHDGLSAATAATTASFVGIYGMEWGVINNGGHVALYDVTKLLSWEAYAEISTPEFDYGALWTTASNPANQGVNGAAGAFCHPKTTDYGNFTQNAAGLSLLRGLAVISGPAFNSATNFTDGGSRYAGPKTTTDLYQFALQRGWKIGPEAHQDNHCWNYGNSTRNRTVALANGLSKASVMGALQARHFYASSDLNAQMFFGTSDYAHTMGDIFTTSASTANLLLSINDPDGATISTVTLYQGNPAAGSGSPTSLTMASQGGGIYTATVNVTASQAYWYAYATLSNGAELWSAPVWITKTAGCTDTTAPTATVTAPTASTVTGTVSVTATGTDNVGVTGMTLKIDGAQVATSATGSISYSWSTTGLTSGSSHTIVATASDACGNVGTSATKTVTIGSTCTDTTAPTATVTAPTSGSSVSGTVSVTATGTDNVGVTGMTLKIDGAQVATSASGSLGYSWNTTGLASGSSHTIIATASDACGNVGTSATTTVTIASTGVFVDPTGNPGFEAATPAPWTESGTFEIVHSGSAAAIDGASVPPRGTKMAWMAGYDNATDILKQNLTIPNVATNVNLGFWRQVHTTDGTGTAFDFLYVEVWNSAGTSKLATLQTLSNRNAGATWIHNTGLSLNTWRGQTIQIRFTATNDTSNPTDFFIDDVTITNP